MAEPDRSPGYEPGDPPASGLVRLGGLFVGVFLLMSALSLGVLILMNYTDDKRAALDVPLPAQWKQQPSPQLTEKQGEHLLELRIRERVLLETYGWVDRDSPLVRIPIERAKQLVVGRLPIRSE